MIWAALRKMWPIILGGLGIVALVFMGRQNGKLRERIKGAEARNKLQGRMRDAAANTRTDRDSVADRLRNGRF